MKEKTTEDERPLKEQPPEHFQPIEEDMGEEQDEEKRGDEVDGRVIPPLSHPYPPF